MIKIINGYYGSGKTTYCKSIEGFKHYQLDYFVKRHISLEEYIMRILQENINEDIVIDFYFKPSYKKYLDLIINYCNSNNIEYDIINIDTSLEESYKRFIKREKEKYPDIDFNFERYKEICEVE